MINLDKGIFKERYSLEVICSKINDSEMENRNLIFWSAARNKDGDLSSSDNSVALIVAEALSLLPKEWVDKVFESCCFLLSADRRKERYLLDWNAYSVPSRCIDGRHCIVLACHLFDSDEDILDTVLHELCHIILEHFQFDIKGNTSDVIGTRFSLDMDSENLCTYLLLHSEKHKKRATKHYIYKPEDIAQFLTKEKENYNENTERETQISSCM